MSEANGQVGQLVSAEVPAAAERARGLPRGVRIADIVVTVLLLLVQAGWCVVALFAVMVIPMTTDSCAYEACGDGKWIEPAMWTALASIVPAGLFASVGFIQLARKRIGFWWVLMGVLAQVGVLWVAGRMADLAGPIAS